MNAEILSIETLEEINNLKQVNKDHQKLNGELRQQLAQTEELALNYKTLFEENKKLADMLLDRIDKAVELIAKEFLCYDNESDEYIQGKKAINILKGEE